jgi:hypothetical protein
MAGRCGSGKLSRADAAVIAALCLLLIVLVPVLFARPREQAVREVCAANLAQIGKAMFLYAGENNGVLPRAGGNPTFWGTLQHSGWIAPDRRHAYGTSSDGYGGSASIGSCFYLLVKYAELPPHVFICARDRGTTEFKLSDFADIVPAGYDLTDLWDFGPPAESHRHYSYSYHIPFSQYALTSSRDPNLAVAADRNPWISSPVETAASAIYRYTTFMPDVTGPGVAKPGTAGQACRGNAITHDFDGQNVLFLDGRVEFAARAFCSLGKDNIYTVSTLPDSGDLRGAVPPPNPSCIPSNLKDSLLVNDPDVFGSPTKRR